MDEPKLFKRFDPATAIRQAMRGEESVQTIAMELTGIIGALDREHQKEAIHHMETEVELTRLQTASGGEFVPWEMTKARLVDAVGQDNADMISKYREELRGLKGEAYKRKGVCAGRWL